MDRQHTPGPFRRAGGNRIEATTSPVLSKYDSGWRTVGHAQACTASHDSDVIDANLEANCNLFLAAPNMLAVLDAYEKWEAELLMDDEAWKDRDEACPRLTQVLWDRLLEIQAMRNSAVDIVEGRTP